ncbi:MAG: DUF3300 domain-containing protein [Betaproteobacteria bacterium]|nr:DUF3300 domain-containing protein [Betaproteobacteria bacterium]
MRTLINRYALPRLLVLLFSVLIAFQPAAFGQGYARPAFTQQELDQMLAPIALYPDPLLSQILMASTYPLEVVEAARWSRARPGLRGDPAVRAVADKDWDPSVKSLVAFPQILAMMDQKLEWTERLGDAFLAQESQVMDTVQDLRHRAYAAGNLRPNGQIRVDRQGRVIAIEPVSPQVVYVPYYDPFVIYGPWWWPAYPPVYWAPWPGYYVRPGYVGFAWGTGIGISFGFFFGAFDWHQHHARVVNVNNYYYNETVIVNRQVNVTNTTLTRNVNVAAGVWRHDPAHRRGAPYRVAALSKKFTNVGTAADARRDFRGNEPAPARAAPSHQEKQPEIRAGETHARLRDNQAPKGSRPEARDAAPRPDTRGAAAAGERHRDARGAEAGSSNRGGPAHRPGARGSRSKFNREAAVSHAD